MTSHRLLTDEISGKVEVGADALLVVGTFEVPTRSLNDMMALFLLSSQSETGIKREVITMI